MLTWAVVVSRDLSQSVPPLPGQADITHCGGHFYDKPTIARWTHGMTKTTMLRRQRRIPAARKSGVYRVLRGGSWADEATAGGKGTWRNSWGW